MTAAATSRAQDRPRRSARVDRRRAARWSLIVVGVATALYFAAAAARFGSVLAGVHSDADLVGPLVVGQHFRLGSDFVTLGSKPLYSTLFFQLATRWLPQHELLWELAAPIETLAAIALITDASRRVLGRSRAFALACVMLCMSPYPLELALGLGTHTPAWLCMAATLWALVWTRERAALGSPWLLAGLALALFTGASAASDDLVYLVTLVPLLAVLAFELRSDGERDRARRRMVLGVGFALATALSAWATEIAGHDAKVISPPGISVLLSPHHLLGNAELLGRSFVFAGNGGYFGAPAALWSAVLVAAAVLLTVVAVAVVFATPVAIARPTVAETRTRRSYVVFWASATVALVVGYLVSSAQQDLSSARYLIGLLWAVYCLAAYASLRWRRVAAPLVVAAVVSILAGAVTLVEYSFTRATVFGPPPSYVAAAAKIAAITRRAGVTRGYAPYWDASPLMWLSGESIHAFPVEACGTGVCAFAVNSLSGWYRPRAGRTFVVVDNRQPTFAALPASFGKPLASYRIDGHITLYLFGYDVASRIHNLP